MRFTYSSENGFSLVELMVVLVISVMLMGMAISSFKNLIDDARLSGSVNEFIGSLILARSEAIKRAAQVSLCPSKNANEEAARCDDVSDGEKVDWSGGWIVFVDENGAGLGTRQGSELVLMRRIVLSNGMSLYSNNPRQKNYRFNSLGHPSGFARFTFSTAGKLPKTKLLCLARTGRVRLVVNKVDCG